MALFPDDNSFCEKGVGALFVIRGKAADTVLVFDCFSSPSDTLGSGFNAPVRAVAAFSGVVPKGASASRDKDKESIFLTEVGISKVIALRLAWSTVDVISQSSLLVVDVGEEKSGLTTDVAGAGDWNVSPRDRV